MRRNSERRTRRLPSRTCLLKGCRKRFRPEHHCSRYCSAACSEAARVWRRWLADQKYRKSKHGKDARKCQSQRYRKRCPKESLHVRKSKKSSAVEPNVAATLAASAAPSAIVPTAIVPTAIESAASVTNVNLPAANELTAVEPVTLPTSAVSETPIARARVGDSQPRAGKKSCCHRPGCYELFTPDPRTPNQKYCSPDCAQAMRQVLVREKKYRDGLKSSRLKRSTTPPKGPVDLQNE
jgi:hypothetical protein